MDFLLIWGTLRKKTLKFVKKWRTLKTKLLVNKRGKKRLKRVSKPETNYWSEYERDLIISLKLW